MSDEKKKEKVLHTRISESLDQEIKKKASNLGISVSNLVRNILMHTVDLVEDIVTDSANIARSARGETIKKPSATAAPTSPKAIIGWQQVILNLNAVCSICNSILPRGSNAAVGITEEGTSTTIICDPCLKETIDESTSQS